MLEFVAPGDGKRQGERILSGTMVVHVQLLMVMILGDIVSRCRTG